MQCFRAEPTSTKERKTDTVDINMSNMGRNQTMIHL